ncbi:hypothetical protein TNCV_2564721 [Trichonephila clavipes]|nr:hypothetical protein TNCV_2564721 [Trichonephila clavipes]
MTNLRPKDPQCCLLLLPLHATNDMGDSEHHQPQHLPNQCVNRVTYWRTALAMSSRVANHLHIDPFNLGNEIKVSRAKCRESTVGAPNLPIPNVGLAAVQTLLYVILHCRTGLLQLSSRSRTIIPNATLYLSKPGSLSSTERSLFLP